MLYPDVNSYIRKKINSYSLALRETNTEPEGYGRFLKITTLWLLSAQYVSVSSLLSPSGISAFRRLGCRANAFVCNRFVLFLPCACGRLPSAFQEPLGLSHHARHLKQGTQQASPAGPPSFRLHPRLGLPEHVTQWFPTNNSHWPLGPWKEQPYHQLLKTRGNPKTQRVHSAREEVPRLSAPSST